MGWPTVGVLIVTWNRPKVLRATLNALKEHLRYSGPLMWHLADDKSPGSYVHDVMAEYPELDFSYTITPRLGWGANCNTGLMYLNAKVKYIFLCEDDYIALRPIKLDQGVALLETAEDVGVVRYDGIAGHYLNLELRECRNTPVGTFSYLRILKHSPFLYVYSHRPHLKHVRFHDYYGLYKQNIPLGATEEDFAKRVYNDKGDGPITSCLADGIQRHFDHVGKTRQGSDADRESSGRSTQS